MTQPNRHRGSNPDTAAKPQVQTRRRRIFYRTALMAWFLVIFTAAIFLAVTIPSQRRQLLEEMRQRAMVAYTSASQVAIESIVLEDFSAIVEHCINMVSQNPGMKYVVLTREDGFSLVHTQTLWQQQQLGDAWKPNAREGETAGRLVENELSEGRAYHVSYPLVYSGINWGWIHLGLSPDKFYKDLRVLYTRTFLVAMLAVVGGLIASFLYARRLSVPIQRLDRFARKIAAGDLSQRIDIQTNDEVQSLAETFNHMVAELNRSNQELVKTARQAGMAEMAVDVLHNVGNVLNSVGVTTQALNRRVRQSRMSSLQPMAEMMKAQGGTLADFIANDPRGRKLPAYISALSSHLEQDHQAITTSLSDLERHIQHIQDIIHLQQSYSRTIGLTEHVHIGEVIEDAIHLNIDAINRHGIQVEQSCEPVSKIWIDRQKLLQILTNLISNAKQAFDRREPGPKTISIRTHCPSPRRLQIVVCDNGRGIARENLTRIFQHGFTTRKEGHGFGLHSSAIAATEMEGTLRAESPGSGQGATFTLELPIRRMENHREP